MKRIMFLAVILLFAIPESRAQIDSDTEVYFLTCMPGTESYSVYGHSAIRVKIPSIEYDQVFNWGVFDFNTPAFTAKFAMGKLNYMLGVSTYERFLSSYFLEERTVYSQRVNLPNEAKIKLFELVTINLQPENRFYLYDFFYDNCATRVRDIFENSLGNNLIYPVIDEKRRETLSFRELVDIYQSKLPWVDFGADMLLGMPSDKKADFREQMFLPYEMMKNLSMASVIIGDDTLPLLEDPEIVIDFTDKEHKTKFLTSPFVVFSFALLLVMWVSWFWRRRRVVRIMDIVLFGTFSVLALIMLFTNIITEHKAMHWNFNILWLNPFILPAFISLFRKNHSRVWFRLILATTLFLVPALLIIPQQVNISLIPVVLILLVRTVLLADFSKPAK